MGNVAFWWIRRSIITDTFFSIMLPFLHSHYVKAAFHLVMIYRRLKCNTQHFHVIKWLLQFIFPHFLNLYLSPSLSVTAIVSHFLPDTQPFPLPSFPRHQTVVQCQALHLYFSFDGVCANLPSRTEDADAGLQTSAAFTNSVIVLPSLCPGIEACAKQYKCIKKHLHHAL